MGFFESLFTSLGPWSWCILGALLLGLELLAPGFIFLWFGCAAFVVGGLAFLVDWSWQTEAVLFATLSTILAIGGRVWFRRNLDRKLEDQPALNDRGGHLVGRLLTLDEPLLNGQGRVKVDDSWWRIAGPDIGEGVQIKVISADGPTLIVAPVETASSG